MRALHHYDRLGLLKPTGRSSAAHRLYAAENFARLQQIVTLKFIGFTLHEIRKLLAGVDMATALRAQRAVLEQKRKQFDQAIRAISRVQQLPASRYGTDWQAFATIIQSIQIQTNTQWAKQYYDEEALRALAERESLWLSGLEEKMSKQWMKTIGRH